MKDNPKNDDSYEEAPTSQADPAEKARQLLLEHYDTAIILYSGREDGSTVFGKIAFGDAHAIIGLLEIDCRTLRAELLQARLDADDED